MSTPGLISVTQQTPSNLMALLYNFDIDSATLKVEHNQWLEKNVKQFRTRNMIALIVGLASRTGPNQWNMDLSRRRAFNVSSRIYLFDPASLLTETKVAFGEEAARIAGLKDRVEDERWRAVFINIHDRSRIPPPPKPKPVKRVQRRTYVKLRISDKPGKYVPLDPADKRAEQVFQAVSDLLRRGGSVDSIMNETWDYATDETWTVKVIKVKRDNYTSKAWKSESVEIWYEWGRSAGSVSSMIWIPASPVGAPKSAPTR
jgi:hypothetical protein